MGLKKNKIAIFNRQRGYISIIDRKYKMPISKITIPNFEDRLYDSLIEMKK